MADTGKKILIAEDDKIGRDVPGWRLTKRSMQSGKKQQIWVMSLH